MNALTQIVLTLDPAEAEKVVVAAFRLQALSKEKGECPNQRPVCSTIDRAAVRPGKRPAVHFT